MSFFSPEELGQPASETPQPSQPTAPTPVSAPLPQAQSFFSPTELSPGSFFSRDATEIDQVQLDRSATPYRPPPATANIRYSAPGDMNQRPRGVLDDRVEDELWAEAIGDGAYSIAGSVVEGVGQVFASIPEAVRQVYDQAVLAVTSDAEEQEYLRDIIRRQKELGMRSEMAAWIRENTRLAPDDVVPGFWTQDLPQAIGNTLGFLGGGVAGAAARVPLWASTAILGGTVGGASFAEDAVAHGATPEEAAAAFGIGSVVGTSEAWPIFRVWDKLDKYSGGKLGTLFQGKMAQALQGKVAGTLGTSATGQVPVSTFRTIGKEGVQGFMEEALQETFQQYMENLTASELVGYDEQRTLGENIVKAGTTGGAVGFLLSTMAAGLGLKMRGTPIESEVARRARELRESGGITQEQMEAILEQEQIYKLQLKDIEQLSADNDAKVQALSPAEKKIYDDLRVISSYGGIPWQGPGHYPGQAREELLEQEYEDLDGKKVTPAEIVSGAAPFVIRTKPTARNVTAPAHNEDDSLDPKATILSGYADRLSPSKRSRFEANLMRFQKIFASQAKAFAEVFFPKGEAAPSVIFNLAEKVNPGTPRGQLAGAFFDTSLQRVGARTPGGGIRQVIRVTVSPTAVFSARLSDLATKDWQTLMQDSAFEADFVRALETLHHELGHGFVATRLLEQRRQAVNDTALGKTDTPAQIESKLFGEVWRTISIDIAKGMTAGTYGDEIMERGGGGWISPGMKNSSAKDWLDSVFMGAGYWNNPHEIAARLTALWASGAVDQQTLIEKFGKVPGLRLSKTLEGLAGKMKASYAAMPRTKYTSYARFLDTLLGQETVVRSFTDPVAIDFVRSILDGTRTPDQAWKDFKGWNTHLDRYGKIIRWGTTILQLEKLNKHIPWLARYVQKVQEWDAFRKKEIAAAVQLIAKARELGKERSNLVFRTLIEETVDGKELSDTDLIARLNADPESVALAKNIKAHFRELLNKMEEVSIAQAKETFTDPTVQTKKLAEIKHAFNELKKKPYFPLMRFGKYAVEVRDTAGTLVEYHLFESKGEQGDAIAELRRVFPQHSVAGRPVKEFELGSQGMPFRFTQALEGRLAQAGAPLTKEQLRIMKELSYDFLPARSFLRRFKKRKVTEGYSQDGMRALAMYTQNAVGFLARAKYGIQLQKEILGLENNGSLINLNAPDDVKDMSKRHEISQHLSRHYRYIMEPTSEWASLRAMGFLYYLGYNVKSAVINLTQVPFVTYPYLAARFGDASAIAAIVKANRLALDYFRKTPKVLSQGQVELLETGKLQGWLDESLASELAVASQDGVVDRILPLDVNGRFRAREFRKLGKHTFFKAAQWGALPFHVVEKFNRNVTALAAYDLAIAKGKTQEQAVIEAREAVQSTQYEYSRWARPEMMRGRKGALFLFKSYLQGTLFFLINDPGAWRYLVMLAVIGGLQGLPFADDLLDLIDGLGTPVKEHLGFKNPKVDVRTELRKEAAELVDQLEINPDLFFHGISSQSFGLSMLGEALGVPIPNLDLSGSLSMGNFIPATELVKRSYKTDRAEEFVGEAIEEIGGPIASMGMGMLAPWIRNDPNGWRRWERALPLAMRGPSKAARIAIEGSETTAGGDVIAEFDIHDPRDRAELVAQALAFTPRKVSKGWERYMAELEVIGYWQAKKSLALADFNYANEQKDREARADAMLNIKEFNRIVPYPQMKVSGDDLRRSTEQYRRRRTKLARGLALQSDFVKLREDYAKAFAEPPEEGSPRIEESAAPE